VYAYEAQAVPADAAPPDNGNDSWLDTFTSLWNSSPDSSYNEITGEIENPLINFGDTPIMGNYKVNEYPKYASAIRDAEISNNIPRDLLARMLYQESRYRKDVIEGTNRSPKGATGIAQFMPATAGDYGLLQRDAAGNIVNDLRLDPFASIAAAGRYLAALYRMFGNWRYALMAYNWGPGNVRKHIQGQGAPQPLETSQYVAQITADVPVA
jgi:soluble lytic murein transglycosylase-like protein